VAALTANLDAMGFFPCTHAVFGAMHDKDLAPMLARIAPLIDRWYLTDLPTPRAETAQVLREKIEALPPAPGVPREISLATFASPQLALDAAVLAAGPTDRIVVFGSFFTVGGVLQDGPPRLNAKHLGT
jgi:dihydrofolate synthase/folylpolyglutamate synthase